MAQNLLSGDIKCHTVLPDVIFMSHSYLTDTPNGVFTREVPLAKVLYKQA